VSNFKPPLLESKKSKKQTSLEKWKRRVDISPHLLLLTDIKVLVTDLTNIGKWEVEIPKQATGDNEKERK